MGNESNRADAYCIAFFTFTIAVIIHNTFAPREIRQELNEYSMKCYTILVLLGLAIGFIIDRRNARQKRKAIEEEQERIRKIREYVKKAKEERGK